MTEQKQKTILAAIASAMGAIGKLGKENQNTFDNYKFTSVDDFLAATSKACSDNGLVVLQDEVSREVITKTNKQNQSTQWLLFDFTFEVFHESGDRLPAVKRSVAVPFTGAQSFGSGQSYALKQFMRSLFQIATGDQDDADHEAATTETPELKPKTPKPITDKTLTAIYEAQRNMECFSSDNVFELWYRGFKGCDIEEQTETLGKALLKFFRDKPNSSDWPVKVQQELEEAIEADKAMKAKLA